MSKYKPGPVDISARKETAVTHCAMGKVRNFSLRKGYKGHGLRDPQMGLETTWKNIELTRDGGYKREYK